MDAQMANSTRDIVYGVKSAAIESSRADIGGVGAESGGPSPFDYLDTLQMQSHTVPLWEMVGFLVGRRQKQKTRGSDGQSSRATKVEPTVPGPSTAHSNHVCSGATRRVPLKRPPSPIHRSRRLVIANAPLVIDVQHPVRNHRS
ncbi:hypothetical protein RRF57_002630 [Xylaria bambusicola]|uniref:Uncharacterized protein n=1 Tax=Xylaria bambusicola TaxID=326684 RepID=A0AAN7YVS0_9PEZI